MASEFITRVERDKDEPYTVIFRTDDADKYKHIEDECRKMIGHAKPTVDAVPVVRCKECVHGLNSKRCGGAIFDDNVIWCTHIGEYFTKDHYCADGERKDGADDGRTD